MKNLKLTQSLSQKVGIEIEETGLRPGAPGGPTCRQGALACRNCEICKIKDLFGELWNFLGDSGRKLVLRLDFHITKYTTRFSDMKIHT